MKLRPAYIAKGKKGYDIYKEGFEKIHKRTMKEAKAVCGDNGWMYIVLRATKK